MLSRFVSLGVLLTSASPAQSTILIGVGVNNGDFEEDMDPADSRTFDETPGWVNLGTGGNNFQATRTNIVTPDPPRSAVASEPGQKIFANDTGYAIAAGDVFSLSYIWRDAFQWDDASDQLRFTLFTTPDDDITNPEQTVLFSGLSGISTENNTWETVEYPAAYVATAADAGRTLFLSFEGVDGNGAANGFARIDLVTLEVDGGTATPFQITSIDVTEDDAKGTVTLTWSSLEGVNYAVDRSTDLLVWQEIDDSVPSQGEETAHTIQLPGLERPRAYYRVRETEK